MQMYRRMIASLPSDVAGRYAGLRPGSRASPPPAKQVNTGLGFGAFGGTWTTVNTENTVQGVDLNSGYGIVAGHLLRR